MSALAVLLLEIFCCLGLGAAALRALRVDADLGPGEQWAIAFAVGFGVLGWLLFPLGITGHFAPLPLTALLTFGCFGVLLLKRPLRGLPPLPADAVGRVLLALLAVVALFQLVGGVAPPADADSLAYQFEVPRKMVAAGGIGFILQPLNGAVPWLVQMTYVPALALGGELAMTLWTMASGWAAAALLFVIARRHLGLNWALAVTLLFLTTPAAVYGAGNGQVEVRIVLFVMVAAWATARALETRQARYAALAGLGGGLFVAAKYTGLLFAFAAGAVVVAQRQWLRHGMVYGLAMLVAGFQWYAWNAIHTGDPVFPMLFQWLGRDDLALWPKAHDLVFKQLYFHDENPLPKTLAWLIAYPFKATLAAADLLDTGRVGFGPYGLVTAPFAALGLWRFRHRARRSPLLVYVALVALFYVLWFFGGGSQRIRHLLPVLPLFLVCVSVAAERFTAGSIHRRPLVAAMAVVIAVQLAGQGVFALNYLKFLANGADRQAFLLRNVNGYAAVPWINANLSGNDLLFIGERQLHYYLRVPNYFGSIMQAMVELRPEATDARTLYRQLRAAGTTHLLLRRSARERPSRYDPPMDYLERKGCLVPIRSFEHVAVRSRTVPTLGSRALTFDVLRLADENCIR